MQWRLLRGYARLAHRKSRYATIVTSPLANQMLGEVSCSFVEEWRLCLDHHFHNLFLDRLFEKSSDSKVQWFGVTTVKQLPFSSAPANRCSFFLTESEDSSRRRQAAQKAKNSWAETSWKWETWNCSVPSMVCFISQLVEAWSDRRHAWIHRWNHQGLGHHSCPFQRWLRLVSSAWLLMW